MKQHNLSVYLWLTSAATVLVGSPVYGDEIAIKDIPKLSDIQRPHTTVKEWRSQQTEIISVTEVRLNQTSSGLEIILKTPTSDKLQVTNKSEGNNFIADIPNVQLRLINGDSFRQEKPIAEITEVSMSNQGTNSIQLKVIGEAGLPKVKLDDSNEGLIFVVTPVTSSTLQQQQPQTPDTPKPSKNRK